MPLRKWFEDRIRSSTSVAQESLKQQMKKLEEIGWDLDKPIFDNMRETLKKLDKDQREAYIVSIAYLWTSPEFISNSLYEIKYEELEKFKANILDEAAEAKQFFKDLARECDVEIPEDALEKIVEINKQNSLRIVDEHIKGRKPASYGFIV
ncbi:MAG: hypothetical protein OH351_02635 [Candidatus Parvarchaeota archaeon]|nr:hypothetical protein [Candidatus Jingweiarchaeum tengchongense]